MDYSFEQAEKARAASQFKAAQRIYQGLLKSKSLEKSGKAEAYRGLADVERIQGFFPQAMAHYEKASGLLKGRPEEGYWDAQAGWALAARACGRPLEALDVLGRVQAAYRKQGDLEGQAFVHWALGGTWRIAGDMKKGLLALQKALGMFQKLKEAEGTAYTCCALGGICRMLGRYADSGKYYRGASRRMRARKDTFGIAYSYCGLGNVERMAGRFRQALPFYRRAEKLYGAIGDRVSYAYTLWSLGTTYKMLGQYARAHRAFGKADQLFRQTGDTRGRIYSLLGFAEVEFLKGRKLEGARWWKKAQAVAGKSAFAWEKLHVEALRDGVVRPLDSRYHDAGSLFHPLSMPVNWP